ncbi:MAG: uridine kinase [Actinomycetota bacterium]|nr:uridine kinase [Actinomycetota bacterium]
MLLDGVGARALADSLVEGLRAAGRAPVRVSAADFLRPAGERFEHGREDAQDFRERWLDAGALRREVLEPAGRPPGAYLPALWDAARDRSARAAVRPLPARAVVLVDGRFLLDHGLPAELVVHVALSSAALRRRGVPAWQLEAFAGYDAEVRPGAVCDVLVRAEDPVRPAVLFRDRPGPPS